MASAAAVTCLLQETAHDGEKMPQPRAEHICIPSFTHDTGLVSCLSCMLTPTPQDAWRDSVCVQILMTLLRGPNPLPP